MNTTNDSQSRNELWFVLEMAKSLHLSSSYSNTAPPAPTIIPRANPPKPKPVLDKPIDKSNDPPILPPGTFGTTPSKPPTRLLVNEVIELETALAAKQAALEQCGLLIDSAVDELTNMSAAGDQFWQDVTRLKQGRKGRGQWAIVPKPDFGGVAPGQKAKDIIIPYAIDEGELAHTCRFGRFSNDQLRRIREPDAWRPSTSTRRRRSWHLGRGRSCG